eukprot:3331188-Pleurochrysis_carterae.AAC.1
MVPPLCGHATPNGARQCACLSCCCSDTPRNNEAPRGGQGGGKAARHGTVCTRHAQCEALETA